jgi:hypothetical protein
VWARSRVALQSSRDVFGGGMCVSVRRRARRRLCGRVAYALVSGGRGLGAVRRAGAVRFVTRLLVDGGAAGGYLGRMQGQLFNSYYETAKPWTPEPGTATWHKGERCIVLDSQDMAYGSMIRVIFPSDGREGIYKPSELGLTADDIALTYP